MRKFYILILMLVIGLSSESQTPQYYNRLPTTGGNTFPFNINAATGKKVQWAIAAGEFNQPSPAPAGNNITAIWFRPNTACNATYTTLTIKFATVSTSTFIPGIGQWYAGPMTTVLAQNTTITTPAALTWAKIPLTTPYPYDPTMNLIIEVSQCGYTGTGFSIFQDVIDVAPNYRRQYSDASSPCGVTVLPTGGQFNVPAIGLDLAAAGCTNTTSSGSATIDPNGAVVTISACSMAGDYSTINGAVSGQTLRFTSSVATDFITIHSGTPSGPIVASGTTPLNFANTFTGTLYAHWNTNASCGTQATCRTTTVQCTSCVPSGCTFSTSAGAATIDPGGAVVTISACSFAGEYSTISGAVNGQSLRFTSSVATDYITIHSGTFNGPIIAYGQTPLLFANTFTGTLYAHWSSNASCGTQATCRTTTVQCTSCASCTITRTSAAGTDNQTVCSGQPITNITYATTGATGATFSGLPAGVTGNWAANVVTISGSPTASGVFNYTVTLTGCAGGTATGTITVNATPNIGIVDNPTGPLCQGDPKLLTAMFGQPLVNYCFTQSTSTAVTSGNSVACNAGGITTDNSYWRVYPLTPYALPGPLTISSVKFGIELSANGPYNVTVNLYTQTGAAFPGGTRTLIRSQVVTVPNQSLTIFTAPITPVTVNPTDVIVIELFTPNIPGVSRFFIGSNAAAQTGTTYLSAAPCGITTPTDIAVIGFPNMHIILDFCGTTGGGGTPIPPGYTYSWSPAAGLSSTTTNPVAASPMVTTTYSVLVTSPAGCQGSGSIPVTVNTRPAITTQPANVTACANSTAIFTAAGSGTGATYQWQVSTNGGITYTNLTNTAPYSGVTTTTLTINPVTVAMNNYRYRMVVSGTCPPDANSNGAILTVNALPVVTVTPATGCGGVAGSSGLLLTASGASSYTWSPVTGLYTNANATTAYTGGNSATVYAAPTTFTVYTVTGTAAGTGCSNTASAQINYTPPAPTVTPSSVTMCLGDPAVKLKSSSSSNTTVQFCSGPLNMPVPDNTPNGINHSITVSGIPASCFIAGMSVTWNMTHTWNGDMVFVLKAPNGNILNLDYNLTNTGGTGATTGFVNTNVSSSGTNALSSGSGTYTATFRADAQMVAGLFGPPGPTGFLPTGNTWTQLYSVPNGTYTLAMYDGGPADLGVLTSWCLNITYTCGVPATAAVWTPAAGLFSDANATVPYVAGTAVDSVWTRPTPSGVYNYQATVQSLPTPPVTVTTPMAGGNGNNLVAFNVRNNNAYPVTFSSISSNAFGSGAITARVFYSATPIAGNPGPISAANGWNQFGTGNYTVTANTLNQLMTGLTLVIPPGTTYGIALDFTGATFPAYTNGTGTVVTYSSGGCDIITDGNVGWGGPASPGTPANNPRNFNGSVAFIPAVGAPCTSPARNIVVTVNQPTTITTQPVDKTICTDKVASFTVAAGGSGPFSYQWQVSTDGGNTFTNIANGGVYSGVTTATLTVSGPPVTMNNYQYRCIVTGAAPCASTTSFKAILRVNPLPTVVITASPYTRLMPGLTTTLSSTVTPVAAQTYTWQRNGATVGGNTGTLNVDVDRLGVYRLTVTDINGCTSSSNSITIADSASGKCFIYPNPTSGMFQVRYYSVANNVLPRSVTVYNSNGDRVLTQVYNIGQPYDRMDVDMRKYGKGLYWVEIGDLNGNRITMCRVAIQ